MTTRETLARVTIAMGLSLWIASTIALTVSPAWQEIFPEMQNRAFVACIATQGIWFFGFLWLIYERVESVKKNKPP
jgi:hypothetical protein